MRGLVKRFKRPAAVLLAGALVVSVAGPALGLWHVGIRVDLIEVPRGQAGFTVEGPDRVAWDPEYLTVTLSPFPVAVVPVGEVADPAVSQRRLKFGKETAAGLLAGAEMMSGTDVRMAIPIPIKGYSDGNVGLRYSVSFEGFDDPTSVLGNSQVVVGTAPDAGQCRPSVTALGGGSGPLSPVAPEHDLVQAVPSSVYHEEVLCLVLQYTVPTDPTYNNSGIVTGESASGSTLYWGKNDWTINVAEPDPNQEPDSWLIITPRLFRPGDTNPPTP